MWGVIYMTGEAPTRWGLTGSASSSVLDSDRRQDGWVSHAATGGMNEGGGVDRLMASLSHHLINESVLGCE